LSAASAKILIAEPAGITRELLAHYLRSLGHDVITATDGQTAWKLVMSHRPDAVILDIALPGLSGLKLIALTRQAEELADTKFVVLTKFTDKRVVMAAAKLRIESYNVKADFNLQHFTDHLAQVLEGQATDAAEVAESTSPDAEATGPATTGTPNGPVGDPPDPSDEAPQFAEDPGPVFPDLADITDLKQCKPRIKRSEIREILDDCGDLKGMSPAVSEVLSLTGRKNCSIDAVAKAVKKDQGVSLKLLKLANSSVYERGEPVESVSKAIMRMGLKATRQAVLNLSVVDQFNETRDPRLDIAHFWEHSIGTGLIAAEITREIGGDDDAIDSAFTMGLLHDSGRMVYADLLADDYRHVLDVSEHLDESLTSVESRLLLVDHAEAMDRVLHAWKFPKHLIHPIALHHLSAGNIRRMAPKAVTECCTLALANALAHTLILGHSGNQVVYGFDDYLEALKVGKDLIDRIRETVPDQTIDLKLAMMAHSRGGWTDYRQQLRDRIPTEVHPLLIGAEPGVDPLTLFFNRLYDRSEIDMQTPNLAVLRVGRPRDLKARLRQLREAETERGIDPLPTLVVNRDGKPADLGDDAAGRAHATLRFPVSMNELIQHCRRLLPASADADAGLAHAA
jgi:HD-like signal output (HDOD) protein/DNA-binding NarL/FixJ family response regulator